MTAEASAIPGSTAEEVAQALPESQRRQLDFRAIPPQDMDGRAERNPNPDLISVLVELELNRAAWLQVSDLLLQIIDLLRLQVGLKPVHHQDRHEVSSHPSALDMAQDVTVLG